MRESVKELLDGGTVKSVSDMCMVVEVEGVELYVGASVKSHACNCCGTWGEFSVSYNRTEEDRLKRHGEADPLGLDG